MVSKVNVEVEHVACYFYPQLGIILHFRRQGALDYG